jgi:hypothetical protein
VKEEPVLSSESEAQISERAAACGDSPVFGSPSDPFRKVQFQIGTFLTCFLTCIDFLYLYSKSKAIPVTGRGGL